jgi:predicted Rossmann fold flavoprotein
MTQETQVLIIGAGASGLMAAIEAGKRGRRVRVIDHAATPGRKILMSGGGRCNFSNREVSAEHYISRNPHFCKSALSRFTQWDFLDLLAKHGIAIEERPHGRWFCLRSAQDLLDMLLTECRRAGAVLDLNTSVERIDSAGERRFQVTTRHGTQTCRSLIVATGGLSIPGAGASPLGYRIAEQFGLQIHPPSPALVPFTLQPKEKERFSALAGIAVEAEVCSGNHCFRENILFTHRGLSGPAMLQASLYWQPGRELTINLLPGTDLLDFLDTQRRRHPGRALKSVLADVLPQRLTAALLPPETAPILMRSLSPTQVHSVTGRIQRWTLKPGGTEGYRTAEVTMGGVNCDQVSSKTMEAAGVPGLFFTGEVLDVTGQLGGYNLQWAWSSGWCAGQYA